MVSNNPQRVGLCFLNNSLVVLRNALDADPLQFQTINFIKKKKEGKGKGDKDPNGSYRF